MKNKINPLTNDYAVGSILSVGQQLQGAGTSIGGAVGNTGLGEKFASSNFGNKIQDSKGLQMLAGFIGGPLAQGFMKSAFGNEEAAKAAVEEEARQQELAQTQYDAGVAGARVNAFNNQVNNLVNPLEQGYAMGGLMGGPMEGGAPIGNNDINYYGEGGSHETNPYGGIPQGMGENGKMNTVEEGEVSVKLSPDTKYIFSDRLIF